MIVDVGEVGKMSAELHAAFVVIALDRRILDDAIHLLRLTVIRHDGLGTLAFC